MGPVSVTKHTDRMTPVRMLEGTARLISNKYDLDVVLDRNGEAATNGTVIRLPYDDAVDEALIMMLMGHETGHVVHSNFSVGPKVARMKKVNRTLLFFIFNALEDARIEIKVEKEFVGFVDMFKYGAEIITERKKEAIKKMLKLQQILDLLYFVGRGRRTENYDSTVADFVKTKLRPYINKAINAKDSIKVFEIAKKVYDLLMEEFKDDAKLLKKLEELKEKIKKGMTCNMDCDSCKRTNKEVAKDSEGGMLCINPKKIKENEKKENEKKKASVQGESGDKEIGGGESGGKPKEGKGKGSGANIFGESTVDGSGGITKTEGGTAHGKSKLIVEYEKLKEKVDVTKEIIKEIEDPKNAVPSTFTSIRDDVKRVIQKLIEENKNKKKIEERREYTINPAVKEKPHETEVDIKAGDLDTYRRVSQSVRREMAFIKTKLQRIVMDKQYKRWGGMYERGRRINRKYLHRIPVGDFRIFQNKEESDIKDVAFTLLVDESGSMSGGKTREARRATIMFGEILDALGVPFEILGFSTQNLTGEQARVSKAYTDNYYNRSDRLMHHVFKRFDEQYNQVKTRLALINAYSNNYDQESVEFAWNRLRLRDEKRKVLIVFSDGMPNGDKEGCLMLKDLIAEISADPNHQVIGIGIQTKCVKQFYPKSVEVERIEELGMNVVQLIEDTFKKAAGIR